nr:bacteriochlorophyll 4-vinyl reductase [Halorhodospira abdelmalekii]
MQEEARIGPNAITQVAAALYAATSAGTVRAIFNAADQGDWLETPPTQMVPESTVARLHHQVRVQLPATEAQAVLSDAGVRTGHYVLQRRIPAFARLLLRLLPPVAAGPLLLRAVERNAWTFIGSGAFSVQRRDARSAYLEVRNNPVIAGEQADEPICHWHAAVFETLFQELAWRGATVVEETCCATGAEACRFVLTYR